MSATETSKRIRRRSVTSHPPAAPRRDQHAAAGEAQSEEAQSEEAQYKAFIRRLHDNGSASALRHTAATALYVSLAGVAVWTWTLGLWPVTIAIWLVMGNLGHSKLIALHESSHGTLNPRYLVNEAQGIFVGIIAHVPLSVYRYVHGQHHAHICSEDDLELWPFVKPEAPLWGRRLAAFCEIVLGYFYTPFHFLLGVIVGKNMPPAQLRRICCEYAIYVVCWGSLVAVVTYRGWWIELTVALIAPGIISGWLQSIRKFTEHMGMLDCTVLGGTRTVVDNSLFGWHFSKSMLHIDYHGTHHRYAKMPYYNLPEATPVVYERAGGKLPLFSTYGRAMLDMFRTLGNPRIGSQWLTHNADAAAVEPRTMRVADAACRTRDIA